uniref:Putative c2h2-type zn-finger protein n=1 Tax=Culex tarsalis TaxID=7177 RepID=A0A1Q3F2E4_CULTA
MASCRLCLQRITGPAISLLDTTADDGQQHDTDLATKIRTCLGVFLDPSSPEEALCVNCHQTVLFVDDFRTLCLQTSDLFGMISVQEEETDKRSSYQMYVQELRRMVQEQRDKVQLISAGVGAAKVKLEPGPEAEDSEQESFMDGIGEVGQVQSESFVISTFEMIKGEPVEEDTMVVEVPKVEEAGGSGMVFDEDETFPLDLKLSLANEMKNHSELWNLSDESYTEAQDQMWTEIANTMSLAVPTVQQYWRRLQTMFQDHLERSQNDPTSQLSPKLANLMSLLETMLKANQDSFDPENVETRLKLANEILKRTIVWDETHLDYDKFRRRTEAWDAIAQVMGTTRVLARTPWQLILAEAHKNPATVEHRLVDPLYRLLHETLAERLRPDSRWPPRYALKKRPPRPDEEDTPEKSQFTVQPFPQKAKRPLGSVEMRNELAEELLKHEVIWNEKHPDYKSSAKRRTTFQEIATRMQVDWKIIRREWGWVVSMSRKSREENGGQVEERLIAKDPLQRLLNITIAERLGKLPGPRKKPNPKYERNGQQEERGKARKVVVNDYCDQCNKYIPRSKFADHLNTHNGLLPYECTRDGCGKRFPTKDHLKKHEINVHSDLRFECTECGRKYAKKCKLEEHFALQHKSQELPCTICGKLLKARSSFLIHMRRHEVKFPCSYCDAQLTTKHGLAEHERIHTKERPYLCENCPERFRTNTAKRLHVYKMHFAPVKN